LTEKAFRPDLTATAPGPAAVNAVFSPQIQTAWVPKPQLVRDPATDTLLDDSPFALAVCMPLDQRLQP